MSHMLSVYDPMSQHSSFLGFRSSCDSDFQRLLWCQEQTLRAKSLGLTLGSVTYYL